MPLHFLNRFVGERMPVAHRDGYAGIVIAAQDALRARPPGDSVNSRIGLLPPISRVMMGDVFRAAGSDQPGERLPGDARERKIDDVRIAEQVVQEGLDRLDRIRPAQLE